MKVLNVFFYSLLILTCLVLAYLLFRKQKEFDLYIKSQNDGISYKPIVISRSNEVKLGEEYISNIYLVRVDNSSVPQVIVNDSIDFNEFDIELLEDTLLYNEDFQTHEYRFTPKRKGVHSWGGVIINSENGKRSEYYFGEDYIVR